MREGGNVCGHVFFIGMRNLLVDDVSVLWCVVA